MSKKKKSFFRKHGVPLAILIVGILVAGAIYYTGQNSNNDLDDLSNRVADLEKVINPSPNNNAVDPTQPAPSKDATVSIDDDPILGNKDKAKVAIVEFSDYECPFCVRFKDDTLDQLKDEFINNDKAILVFRDLPLDFHDPAATREAIAAECVQEEGGDDKYYEYHDKIFETSPGNGGGISVDDLAKLAGDIGVDSGKVKSCIENEKFKEEVLTDKSDASKVGINGTPGFVVGKLSSDGMVEGEVISGAQPFENFKTIIEKYL